jgi:hypothetical protein
MSIPNVARLEPQRVDAARHAVIFLPGGMLELPLTTTQDYTLFHVLNDILHRIVAAADRLDR